MTRMSIYKLTVPCQKGRWLENEINQSKPTGWRHVLVRESILCRKKGVWVRL